MSALPWDGLAIAATTVVVAFVFVIAVQAAVQAMHDLMQALRGRLAEHGRRLRPSTILLVPVWLAAELVWLIVRLLLGLVFLWTAYESAKAVRNWWHDRS